MQSAVEICNVALSSYLGARPITAMEQQTPEAEACRLHYDRVRRSLLERADWTFATRRAALARLADNDRESWTYRYARPADMLKLRWVNAGALVGTGYAVGQNPDAIREISADAIYTHMPGAVIEYTADVTDPTLFPPSFGDAFAAALAAAIAMPITRDGAKMQAAQENAAMLLEQAIVNDANQRPNIPVQPVPPVLAVRGIGVAGAGDLPPIVYPGEAPPLPQVPNIIPMPTPVPGSADGTPFDFVAIYQQAKQ